MTHKADRDKDIDFTISYFFDGQSFLVRKISKLNKNLSFSGKYVGIIEGSSAGDNLKKLVPKARVIEFVTYEDALKSLKMGSIDAITSDLVWCTAQAKKNPNLFKTTGGTITVEPYGMGVPENQSNFRDAINVALQNSVKDGTYKKLYKKWFDKEPEKLPEVWPN